MLDVADVVVLLLGVACAGVGGELFVRGAIGLAAWARVPARVIGTTVAAFATSSPELSVGLQAAAAGEPAIALGDALGSNVINLGLVLGITIAFGSIRVRRRELRRDLAVAAAAPALAVAALVDGSLVRAEAAVLVTTFVVWLTLITRQALRDRAEAADTAATTGWRAIAAAVVGLGVLVLAGRLVVVAAKGIGEQLGLDPFVVGATLVAVGTSAPELATSVVSCLRGHADVGLGTVLGSNVFNTLWIVGVVGLLHPIEVPPGEVLVAVVAGVLGVALAVPDRSGTLARWRGAALVALVAAYSVVTVALGP